MESKVSVWMLTKEHDGEEIQAMIDEDIERYEKEGWLLIAIEHVPVDRRAVMLLRFCKSEM